MYTENVFLAVAQPLSLLRDGVAGQSFKNESALSQSQSATTFRIFSGLENFVDWAVDIVQQYRYRRQSIRQLNALNDRLLADIGIERFEIADVVDRNILASRVDTQHSPSTLAA